jgi:hypothetical protein
MIAALQSNDVTRPVDEPGDPYPLSQIDAHRQSVRDIVDTLLTLRRAAQANTAAAAASKTTAVATKPTTPIQAVAGDAPPRRSCIQRGLGPERVGWACGA